MHTFIRLFFHFLLLIDEMQTAHVYRHRTKSKIQIAVKQNIRILKIERFVNGKMKSTSVVCRKTTATSLETLTLVLWRCDN